MLAVYGSRWTCHLIRPLLCLLVNTLLWPRNCIATRHECACAVQQLRRIHTASQLMSQLLFYLALCAPAFRRQDSSEEPITPFVTSLHRTTEEATPDEEGGRSRRGAALHWAEPDNHRWASVPVCGFQLCCQGRALLAVE